MLRQLDIKMMDLEEEEKVRDNQAKEPAPVPAQKIEPMEVEIKKEKEEGELEEGELPDTKSVQPKKVTVAVSPVPACESSNLRDSSIDSSVPFSQAQIRELFKILPESSLMGAEVSRTFAQLCSKAIIHKNIY